MPLAVGQCADGTSITCTWRGRRRRTQVIGRWKLATKWWEPSERVDRAYYRVTTADQQMFEVYQDAVGGGWVLDAVLD
jgi:hypothetical protein